MATGVKRRDAFLGLLRHSHFARAERAKEFAQRGRCIMGTGDRIERVLLGTPVRYGNMKLQATHEDKGVFERRTSTISR